MSATAATTDFAGGGAGGLIGLRAMIEDADPGSLDTVSARWTAIHQSLVAAQTDLQAHATAALEHWQGDAADGFAGRAKDLCEALGNGAEYASNTGTGVSTAADALRLAKRSMPTVPSEWGRIKRAFTSERGDHAFKQDLGKGMTRDQAIKQDGGQLSLLEERHQQAIAVMERLESSYNSAAQMIGEGPRDSSGEREVWPPPPAATRRSPVTGKDSSAVADPGTEGNARLVDGGGSGRSRSMDGPNPGNLEPGERTGGDGSGDGVSGGEYLPASLEPSTTIQGGIQGVAATGDTPGGSAGVVKGGFEGGMTGPRPVSDSGSHTAGGGIGDSDLDAIASSRSGNTEADREGPGVDSPLAEPAGQAVEMGHREEAIGEGFLGSSGLFDGGLVGAEEPGSSGAGEGFIERRSDPRVPDTGGDDSRQSRPGIMGGVGVGNERSKKRKRRARAHYLHEDEESWVSHQQPNPPVIR